MEPRLVPRPSADLDRGPPTSAKSEEADRAAGLANRLQNRRATKHKTSPRRCRLCVKTPDLNDEYCVLDRSEARMKTIYHERSPTRLQPMRATRRSCIRWNFGRIEPSCHRDDSRPYREGAADFNPRRAARVDLDLLLRSIALTRGPRAGRCGDPGAEAGKVRSISRRFTQYERTSWVSFSLAMHDHTSAGAATDFRLPVWRRSHSPIGDADPPGVQAR